jgi:hypothetical protein
MQRSETITALAKALSAAQGEMFPPKKSKTAKAGSYSYSYSDLACIKDTYRAAFAKRGLSVIHSLAPVNGHMLLTTTLLHESGEWIASDYPIPAYDKPQEQGSALTYFKRYNVCALLDIAPEDEDDDGAAAQHAEKVERPVFKKAPSSGDASVVRDLAEAIADTEGGSPADIIAAESRYTRGDTVRFFSDPMAPGVTSGELAVTRKKLEARLKKLTAKEPGAAEAAALLR